MLWNTLVAVDTCFFFTGVQWLDRFVCSYCIQCRGLNRFRAYSIFAGEWLVNGNQETADISLKITCVCFSRFVIHKHIRRDLIPNLPLPRRMIDYLNTPHYYSEHFVDLSDSGEDQQSQNEHRLGTPSPNHSDADPNVPVNNYIIMNNANSE